MVRVPIPAIFQALGNGTAPPESPHRAAPCQLRGNQFQRYAHTGSEWLRLIASGVTFDTPTIFKINLMSLSWHDWLKSSFSYLFWKSLAMNYRLHRFLCTKFRSTFGISDNDLTSHHLGACEHFPNLENHLKLTQSEFETLWTAFVLRKQPTTAKGSKLPRFAAWYHVFKFDLYGWVPELSTRLDIKSKLLLLPPAMHLSTHFVDWKAE